jgi:hypothetical protein
LAAAVALLEVLLHLGGGLGERLVAGGAPVTVAQPLRVPAQLLRLLTDLAAEQVTAELQQPTAEPGHRMLELRRVPVPASHAVELELVALAGRAVGVVVRERHHGHDGH